MPQRRITIAWTTCLLLVVLRLAIGWHFFFEGVAKYESVAMGPTDTNKPWTSAGYLHESVGPLRPFFQWQAGGDPDETALALFDVQPVPEGQDPAQVPYRQRIPPALDSAWNDYLQRFADHYQLDDAQRQAAQDKLDHAKERAVRWLLGLEGTREAENSDFPTATFKEQQTPLQRINAYRASLAELQRIQGLELPAFGRDTEHQKLRTLKSDTARMRAELLADLDSPMQQDLESVLTAEKKRMGPIDDSAPPLDPSAWIVWRTQAAVGQAEPAPPPPPRIAWVDWSVRWGLLVIGACLLLGLCTRPACLAGAAFMLMIYLAMPPFPWLPENLHTEGHYLFVNKELIEMLALLTLATTRSGRWVGLDGLLQFLNPWRWRSARLAPEARGPVVVLPGAQTSRK